MDDRNAASASPPATAATATTTTTTIKYSTAGLNTATDPEPDIKEEPEADASEELSSDDTSIYGTPQAPGPRHSPSLPHETDGDEAEAPLPKKQKQLSDLPKPEPPEPESTAPADTITQNGKPPVTKPGKKSKKKSKDVWSTTSRKGKKKTKHASNNHNSKNEERVLVTPIPRFPDKNDDSPDLQICLSKVYKADKVELSEDRLSAGSTKGYRMVRATRGVSEGAWYFEIKVGETGHTRLGWSTDKGDLHAPVGYDGNSFGYRDIDGCKVHKALREKYGEEGYREGDVIGFYINLPDGGAYAPNLPRLVWYKGQRCVCAPDAKDDPPKAVPGSVISFFKNGISQGVAFSNLNGGQYYPAASMYTLPNQPNCIVRFNFGPDFEAFPEDFDGHPVPRPMIEVPYQDYDGKVENGVSCEKKQ